MAGRGPSDIRSRPVGQGGAIAMLLGAVKCPLGAHKAATEAESHFVPILPIFGLNPARRYGALKKLFTYNCGP